MGRLFGKFIIHVQEQPSGTVNGTNTTFTLSATPGSQSSVHLYLNGLFQLQGTDYTISNLTITMTVAPINGQTLAAIYDR